MLATFINFARNVKKFTKNNQKIMFAAKYFVKYAKYITIPKDLAILHLSKKELQSHIEL